MSEKQLGKSEMSSVAFASSTMKNRIAPIGSATNVEARIRLAARRLGWTFSRTKDVWYADPRVSIDVDEMRVIEETADVKYGRAEVRSIDELIAKADALLEGQDPDFYRPMVDAFRAFVRSLDRT
jgi:hypothetical protein